MNWLKKLFCKLFGCKCSCKEVKEVKTTETVAKLKVEKKPSKKPAKKTTKKKVAKKTTKTAK